jgi:hypothetical protein
MLRKISRERALSVASALDSAGRSGGADMGLKNGRNSAPAQGDQGPALAIEKMTMNCQTCP